MNSKTKQYSAIILDAQNDKTLITLITRDLGISMIKIFSNAKDTLEVIQKNSNTSLVFVSFETLQDHTFSFMKAVSKMNNSGNTKFVLLAEKSSKQFLLKASKSGFSAFILKPFTHDTFLKKIHKLVPGLQKRHKQRVNLLESIEATLRYKEQLITGAIKDISDDGCLIHTPHKERIGLEVYDVVTIKVNFDDERFGINGEVVRLEKDSSKEYRAVSTALKFTKPNDKNALQFAKFWAYILKEREI